MDNSEYFSESSETKDAMVMKFEKYYMKTRGKRISQEEANLMGIKRIYNYTSDVDFMSFADMDAWGSGLYDIDRGEAIIIESAFKEVNGVHLYIMSCIVFHTAENSNLYYLRYIKTFNKVDGFLHLYN